MAIQEVKIPDLGGGSAVDVIEILVKEGDHIEKEQSIITLEGEKASMEVPSPVAGVVKEIKIKIGDKVDENDLIMLVEVTAADSAQQESKPAAVPESKPAEPMPVAVSEPKEVAATKSELEEVQSLSAGEAVHAGPAVRRLAYEFGVDLMQIQGTGEKNRILKEDVQQFVKAALSRAVASGSGIAGLTVAAAPKVDFAKFGPVEIQALSKMKRLTGVNTHRSWVTVPHVTQFDEADVTEMEAFRIAKKADAEKMGIKLTPLAFLLKAVVKCLQIFPSFNASLDETGENIILKKYFHIGVAVDTPNGLVVPVIRDVQQKGLYALSKELADVSKKAREKGLTMNEMSGSCFTISSLGGIGGTAFTPIVNAPDVAILGVSKSQMKPVWINNAFEPRLMLPLSLSYDHRVIDGAEAARFTTTLAKILTDIKELLL